MFTYWKMKKYEWKVKAMFYKSIASVIENQKEIFEFLQKIYVALKDLPADELQKELVLRLAELIHDENKDNGC